MKRQHKKYVRWSVEVLIIIIALVYASWDAQRRRPHVILVTFDALRPDHLGYNGYPHDTSPFLDALARESVVFTNCVTHSASTPPCLAALLTSKFPYLDHTLDAGVGLGAYYPTIPEFLKKKGYVTVAVVGSHGLKRKFGFSRGFDFYDDEFENYRKADEFLGPLKRIMAPFDPARDKIFLWIHFREPHFPYDPPEDYKDRFLRSASLDDDAQKASYILNMKSTTLTKRAVRDMIAGYDGNIRYADFHLEKIFSWLRGRGVLDNALVIISADHAELLGENHIIGHNYLFHRTLAVPLIVQAPGYAAAVREAPVGLVDIFPTIVDLLRTPGELSRMKMRGTSLLKPRDSFHLQYSEYPGLYSVMVGKWRLIFAQQTGDIILSNVGIEPNEGHNYFDLFHPVTLTLLEELLDILKTGKNPPGADKGQMVLDREDVQALKALGYLH